MPRFEIVDTLNLLVKGQDSPNPPEILRKIAAKFSEKILDINPPEAFNQLRQTKS